MTFLENIFERLQRDASAPVVREIHEGRVVSVTGGELLAMVQQARDYLVARGLKKGDRCALLAPNSIRWVALDVAMMAEGIIVVPLYSRQAAAELVGMMQDSTPARMCCSDPVLVAEVQKLWPVAPKVSLLNSIFAADASQPRPPIHHLDSDALTIIYTSGSSGEPKGVVLNAGNVNHMLGCTNARLDQLMGARTEPDRIFQYGPFSLAASWILLLTALSRSSVLSLSMHISKLSDEMKVAAPNYFLNVPLVLERVRAKVEEMIAKRRGIAAIVFARAQQAYARQRKNESTFLDSMWLWLANTMMFPAIRKSIGPNLKALICGSAPLALETQLFYMMIGIPVLQAYGLTETTAICTLDDPHHVEPGRVGPAVPGMEMTLGENSEILARGPNIFPGYWQRPGETARALEGGWFHTGDQGEVDESGNWKITGRLKNLIVLNSGHKMAPEPLEESLARQLPGAGQVVLLGNERSFLAALVAANKGNGLTPERIQSALETFNAAMPHYKQIRAFHLVLEPFTPENGLLTMNGKLKRDAIAERFATQIEQLFQKKGA